MKKELSRNWEYITIRRDPARAEFICKNLQRWGFETFIMKNNTVTAQLRFFLFFRKNNAKNNQHGRYKQ